MGDLCEFQLVAERRAVEEAKQQLGEEQLAVVELGNQVSSLFDFSLSLAIWYKRCLIAHLLKCFCCLNYGVFMES